MQGVYGWGLISVAHRLNTSELKGTNSRVKMIKRMDTGYFFLKIKATFPDKM